MANEIGGLIEQEAFCLLDGFVEDPVQGKTQFRLPINRLPANLGRTHVPAIDEDHFFGLGKTVKALSRLQCKIDFRTNQGIVNPLSTSSTNIDPKFIPAKETKLHNPTNEDVSNNQKGYFAVTCLGKNPIKVNGRKVEQNESCVLVDGAAIKISGFCLYFLLPESTGGTPKTLEVPSSSPEKKRKLDAIRPTSVLSSSNDQKVAKKQRGNAWTTIQEQLDAMPTEDLLQQLDDAVEKGVWDRRCQFVGATAAYRAVKEAAESLEVQKKALNGGISKAEVVDWIQDSPRFKNWSIIMQGKLEVKSYQSSISKAMARAGYERVNNKHFGRHVRWTVPPGTKIHPEARNARPENKASQDDVKNETEGDAGGEGEDDIDEEGDVPDEEGVESDTPEDSVPKTEEGDGSGEDANND